MNNLRWVSFGCSCDSCPTVLKIRFRFRTYTESDSRVFRVLLQVSEHPRTHVLLGTALKTRSRMQRQVLAADCGQAMTSRSWRETSAVREGQDERMAPCHDVCGGRDPQATHRP